MAETVIYIDDHMLVAEKPAGLLSVPGRLPENKDCLITRLQADYPDALTVHRLDMATSGLMIFARGAEAQRTLSKAFADRQVSKRYIAVVAGRLEGQGEVDLPLITDWPNRPRQKIDHEIGKPSLTRWRALAQDGATTRVELEPVTGRSHQLRVHMMAIGHPILGDVFYAPADIEALSPRLLLHAECLTLPHPVSGERLNFRSPAPF
ncbi:pseudouridine synthase [Asticcacaulis taihuensis]|uniref:Dual-specificity RNA pseudouridine synthase RluA n=1 Tax=Asticcacaulis taihuensis TaxID=260084 RepID=A0A1G4S0P7_9CAUL|nr:tRNA pseudouridine32 synthase / 23S rRNA pseudouridine746 synthase [Asticcacaulis taihuensis]